MKNNILIPTDFTDNAWSATVYALKLFAGETCTFYFLYSSSMRVSSSLDYSNKLKEHMDKHDMQELTELKKMAAAANTDANHEFEIILSYQSLQDAIDTTIKKHGINLIVMGTKGATKAKKVFFGSNTVKTIKKIKLCPVLIIPEEFDFVIPKQIAFPTNFDRFYTNNELSALKHIAELYNSKIRVMHINREKNLTEMQDYNFAMLKAYLEDYPHSFHWMPDYEKTTQEIMDFIEELSIDILVMVNYKHSFIEDITKEPVINKIGFHPKVPFLVIPE